MRHKKAHRQLGRNSSHRRALFSNMVGALFQYGQIETTEAKAKELRGHAERCISKALTVASLTSQDPKKLSAAERAKIVHVKRMIRTLVSTRTACERLFSEIAPAMVNRPGGYTRVLKTRNRVGDAAPMAIIELVAGQPAKAE